MATGFPARMLCCLALLAASPVHGAPAPAFDIHTVLDVGGPLRPGDFVWDEEGAPAGRAMIVVDLQAEQLYVYRGGVEIGRSSIIYGDVDKPTPTGTFPILGKKAQYVSRKYGSPMPYSLWLTKSGVAIHGSEVSEIYATHGCVGVPEEFAELLFSSARVGDRVLITNGWMRDVYG